jgi:hypothetical protein
MAPRGAVAEWLGRGLQSLVQRFESARRLFDKRSERLALCFAGQGVEREDARPGGGVLVEASVERPHLGRAIAEPVLVERKRTFDHRINFLSRSECSELVRICLDRGEVNKGPARHLL